MPNSELKGSRMKDRLDAIAFLENKLDVAKKYSTNIVSMYDDEIENILAILKNLEKLERDYQDLIFKLQSMY